MGDKTFADLGTTQVTSEGTTITVTGTINHVADWPEFSSEPQDLTGYYVAVFLNGDGFIGKTVKNGSYKIVAVADCSDGWIVAVDKDTQSFEFDVYRTKELAESKTGGEHWTVDLSGVSYGE